MLEEGSDACFVRLLAYWYSNQMICVAWQGCYSNKFIIGNGTKQGGVSSPYLFTRYVQPLGYFMPHHKADLDVTLVG